MDYRRYALAWFGQILWVECKECSHRHTGAVDNVDERSYVFQWRGDSPLNFDLLVGSVMRHENQSHPTRVLAKAR